MTRPGIDILFLVRHAGVIAALAFLPLLVVGAVSRKRRWLFPVALSCGLGGWFVLVIFSTLALGKVARSWPTLPFQIGPSTFALLENGIVLAVTLWVPAAISYVGLRYLAENRGAIRIRRGGAISAFLVYTVVATPWSWIWCWENTFAAPGFTTAGWSHVTTGMDRMDVEKTLGPPIQDPYKPAFAHDQGAECWVSNFSIGHFACVWFRSDRVERKMIWYSD